MLVHANLHLAVPGRKANGDNTLPSTSQTLMPSYTCQKLKRRKKIIGERGFDKRFVTHCTPF